jgi:predicted MFS family arabinose efflux permease
MRLALVIMVSYYALCAYLAGLLLWNFVREKKNRDNLWLYLVVTIPLLLRLFRIK